MMRCSSQVHTSGVVTKEPANDDRRVSTSLLRRPDAEIVGCIGQHRVRSKQIIDTDNRRGGGANSCGLGVESIDM